MRNCSRLSRKISGARDVIPQATGLTVRFSRAPRRQELGGAQRASSMSM